MGIDQLGILGADLRWLCQKAQWQWLLVKARLARQFRSQRHMIQAPAKRARLGVDADQTNHLTLTLDGNEDVAGNNLVARCLRAGELVLHQWPGLAVACPIARPSPRASRPALALR